MVLRRWHPLHGWAALQEQMERHFEDPWGEEPAPPEGPSATWSPLVDIQETAEALIVTAELPGVKEEQITVELQGRTLVLRGERSQDPARPGENFHRVERVYGPFQRAFTLAVPVEEAQVRANFRHGVLEVYLPKKGPARRQTVPVTTG